MEHLPKKSTLPRETTSVLKDWILRGVLAGSLPGELRLKQRLCVGRDTLRLALNILEAEGWIGAAVKGKQRQVLMRPANLIRTMARCIRWWSLMWPGSCLRCAMIPPIIPHC